MTINVSIIIIIFIITIIMNKDKLGSNVRHLSLKICRENGV